MVNTSKISEFELPCLQEVQQSLQHSTILLMFIALIPHHTLWFLLPSSRSLRGTIECNRGHRFAKVIVEAIPLKDSGFWTCCHLLQR